MYGLCLFDAQIVSRYGGSIRCIVSKNKTVKTQRLKDLLEIEHQALIENCEETYNEFKKKVESSKNDLIKIISKLKNGEKQIIAKSCPLQEQLCY